MAKLERVRITYETEINLEWDCKPLACGEAILGPDPRDGINIAVRNDRERKIISVERIEAWESGDVVIDAEGGVFSYRDGHWLDGGWATDVEDGDSTGVYGASDEELCRPLTLLARNGKPVSPS